MKHDVHQKFGNYGESEYAESLQKGEREPMRALPPFTQEMLRKTRYDNKIPRIPVTITQEEIKNTWRITKEKKASSPSGRYNAVYKAMTMDPYLLQHLTTSMNLPFLTGHPYNRWSTYLDIMAFKKKDSIRIDSLRSIILSEADWNAAGRIYVTKKMMGQAERYGLLPEEHLGGRKGRKSIDGAITKQIYIDNVNATKTPTVIISTDAANCYDRMVHKYISMMCSKWGLAKQVMKALLQPLREARHYTRTAYGDSRTCFTGTEFQGAGQGNTGAAPFWTCVSTSMIEVMKEAGFTSNLTTPMTGKAILLSLIAFVDDAELFLSAKDGNIKNLISKAQKALETWKHVLLATGGAMRSKKCAWILLDHLVNNSNPNATLTLCDDDGIIRNIERYNEKDPREYLGVTQTVDEGNEEQIKIINRNVLEWNENISKSKLPAALNLKALMNRIHKKILYPLPATTITNDQLQEISDTLYATSLPKCGIIRSFPIRFRTIPIYYFGLGMPDLYLEMQINKVKEFLQHCLTDSVLGKQLQFHLETMQMQAGVGNFILNYDYNKFSHLVYSGWVTHMWKFTSDMKYTFSGWTNVLKPQRKNDIYIMEEFVRFGYTKKKLQLLNKCRIYLHAISLADIVNGRGNQISKNYLQGHRDVARRSTFSWPDTKRPGYSAWCTWSSAIREVFCINDTGVTLKNPLGVWEHIQYCDWDWYYDPTHDILYNKQVRHVIKYSPTRERRTSERIGLKWYKAREILKSHVPIEEYERATITKETKGVKLVSFHGSARCNSNREIQKHSPKTLLQMTEASQIQLPPLHEHNFMSITTSEVLHLLTSGFRIVADGSYKENDSSYCTILESSDTQVQIVFTGKCVQNISDDTKNTDPYRSEMMGLYAGMLLTYIMEKHSPHQAKAILSSDNDAALDAAGTFSYTKVGQQHFDIIKASISLRKSLLTEIHVERVLGHADAKSPKRPPTRPELLNQSCDFMAKVTREYAKPIGPLPLPLEGLSMWRQDSKIYNNFEETIRYDYYTKKATPVICEKFQMTTQQMRLVDWKAKCRSTKLLSSYSNLWISKYATGFLPIAVNMERRNEWKQDYCSRCGRKKNTKI